MRAVADFCIRHRRLTVLAWIVALIAAGAAASSAGESFSTNFQLPDSDSTKALNLLEDRFPAQSGDQIQVVYADPGGLDQAGAKQQIDDLVAELGKLDHVVSVTSPYEGQGAISQSGSIGFSTVTLDGAAFDLPISSIEKIADTANEAGGNGLRVEAGGDPVRQVEQQNEGGSEMYRAARRDRRPLDHLRLGRRDEHADRDRDRRPRHRAQPDHARDPHHRHRRLRAGAGEHDRARRRHRLRAVRR